jgi:hypothetical protein
LIEEVYELFHADEAVEDVVLNELPTNIREKITRALNDYRSGNYITHGQMKQKMQQWLLK